MENSVYYHINQFFGIRQSMHIDWNEVSPEDRIIFGLGVNFEI